LSQRNRDASISVSKVVKRTFERWGLRRKGKALVFIIDEVGQHVARSGDKIEDLRATIEEFGKVGKNLLKEGEITAPCWIVVTSQEKLDEVVAAIDSKRIELATLQARFHYRVDLAPSDIREVATKRVLAKKPEAEMRLKQLFFENQGLLNAALRLPWPGKLKIAGGLEGPMRESINRAFAYLMGQKVKMGVGQQIDTTDFHVEAIDLLSNRVPCDAGIALVVAVYSAIKRQSAQSVRSLAEPLQVAMDNGARRALVPLENKRNFLEVSGDIVERVDPIFFSDPLTAAMKAIGMT